MLNVVSQANGVVNLGLADVVEKRSISVKLCCK